ncbi:TCB2 [Hepatospora eriocheir]|uniref:TCB2 n=1 Tax=Hepatospora eriocheir TaxID=1081669 RepID=A0A1X0Q6I0_9MICR|nr:TCB2 [Hepatospora eriocheir]
MSKQLPYELLVLIKDDLSKGISQRIIAIKRNVSKTAVSNVKFKIDNNLPITRKYGSVRPQKLNDDLKSELFKVYDQNHRLSLLDITKIFCNKFNIEISRFTIARILKDFGLITKKPAKKPLLRPQNIVKRFNSSKKFLGISNETLDTIIFSDECKFNLFTSDGIQYVRYLPGERYKPENTVATVKHGGGCLMFWGCISSQGVGRLVEVESTMTAASYKQILSQNLLASARKMGLDEFIFMQDNDPKHTARLVNDWFDENDIDVLEWPPQSPDLNPIEAVLAYIKFKLAKIGKLSKIELREKIQDIWYSLPQTLIAKYVKSFNKRI